MSRSFLKGIWNKFRQKWCYIVGVSLFSGNAQLQIQLNCESGTVTVDRGKTIHSRRNVFGWSRLGPKSYLRVVEPWPSDQLSLSDRPLQTQYQNANLKFFLKLSEVVVFFVVYIVFRPYCVCFGS